MKIVQSFGCAGVLFTTLLSAQTPPQHPDSVPIYSVTVTERTTKAINYEYRSLPTPIDFRGTVLMPKAKGDAMVESKRGRTEIDAHFDNVAAPTQFGREYLTYVLWAITPEGAPHNLGEIVANSGDKGHLHVTTDLQAFGLIVTAEPYSATHQPSDVVVMENEVRPETVGKIQEIRAKYDLLPRGHYTLVKPNGMEKVMASMPKVSMDQYEAQLEIYEAQNALQIARAAKGDQYAPQTFEKAEQLFNQAQSMLASKGPTSRVVQDAREAAQTAEDARVIAERRQQQETAGAAAAEIASAQQVKAQAQADVSRAVAEANAARAQADAERAARERAEAEIAVARQRAAQAEAVNASPAPPPPQPPQVSQAYVGPQDQGERPELRMRLLEQLNGVAQTRDTPRGLVVTLNDPSFSSSGELRGPAYQSVGRIAAIVSPYQGLRIEVEGHSDTAAGESLSWKRAEAVDRVLEAQGLPHSRVAAKGLGDARPLTSNATPYGREQNRRVEIVISGEPIGRLPIWDHTYSLTRSR